MCDMERPPAVAAQLLAWLLETSPLQSALSMTQMMQRLFVGMRCDVTGAL